MILPGSQLFNIVLLIFGMLCLGTWANTFRMTSKWRFELYCFDFAIGACLAAILLGLTFGSLGWDGFALADDVRIAGKQQDAFAMLAGVVFNLGNMLIIGALSVAGITVAYLIGVGFMLTSGMVFMHFRFASGYGPLLAVGAVMILVAAVLLAYSWRQQALERLIAQVRMGKTKSTRKSVDNKGLLLAIGGGIIAGIYLPLVSVAANGENGLGPYALGIFFAIGIGISTFIFNLFFMNLPVSGDPLELTAYFKGKARFHGLGMLGGIIWYLGLASTLIAARAEGKNVVMLPTVRALMLGAALVGALWGLLRWKEFAGATAKVKTILLFALFAFAMGIVGLSAAVDNSFGG
jgi:glucose uptake protein